jgi:long-chain acyl-CoA synthetase
MQVKDDFRFAPHPYSLSEAVSSYSVTRPDITAIIDRGIPVSYAKLEARVCDVSQLLASLDINAGSIVWSVLSRCLDFIALFIAVQRLHASLVPLAPDAVASFVRELRGHIPPSVIAYHIAQAEHVDKVLQALSLRSENHLTSDYLELRMIQNDPNAALPQLQPGSYVNFTSGTTALSKAVICSPTNIFWNTRAAVYGLGLRPTDVHFCTFPVHIHPHEIFSRALYLGGTTVLMDFPELCSNLKQVNDLGITVVMSTPALLDAMLRRQQAERIQFSNIRLVESGGSITPIGLIQAWREHNKIVLTPVWGSAETTGIALMNTDPLENANLLDPIVPYYEAEVFDKGERCSRGQSGELRLKGPAIAHEYVANNPREPSPFRDGWYYTGDICSVISESQFVFEHRAKGAIKPKGITVYPDTVETVLRQIVGVRDVVVLGIQDERRGEVLAAAVVLQNPGDGPSIRKIRETCKQELSPSSIPQYFELLDELPLDEAGKISRRMLGELIMSRIRSRPV